MLTSVSSSSSNNSGVQTSWSLALLLVCIVEDLNQDRWSIALFKVIYFQFDWLRHQMALCKALLTRLNSRVLADILQGGVVVSMHLESLPVWAFTNIDKERAALLRC